MTQTTNIGLKKIDGSENWRQIFDYHNDSADKTDSAVAAVQDGLAIVADGNTHAAVAEGQFVYVRNHDTLADGLYKATAAIATNETLSTSNLTADGSGGLNDLQEQVVSLNSKFTRKEYQFGSLSFEAGTVGTRGLQTSIDITADLNTYGTLISLLITLVSDSSKSHFQVFRYGNTIVLNGYRATASAMSNNSVFVLATYMKN